MDTVAFIGISSTKSGYFVDTVAFIGISSTKSGYFVDESQDLGLLVWDRMSTMASATDCDAPVPPSSWRISA